MEISERNEKIIIDGGGDTFILFDFPQCSDEQALLNYLGYKMNKTGKQGEIHKISFSNVNQSSLKIMWFFYKFLRQYKKERSKNA